MSPNQTRQDGFEAGCIGREFAGIDVVLAGELVLGKLAALYEPQEPQVATYNRVYRRNQVIGVVWEAKGGRKMNRGSDVGHQLQRVVGMKCQCRRMSLTWSHVGQCKGAIWKWSVRLKTSSCEDLDMKHLIWI